MVETLTSETKGTKHSERGVLSLAQQVSSAPRSSSPLPALTFTATPSFHGPAKAPSPMLPETARSTL